MGRLGAAPGTEGEDISGEEGQIPEMALQEVHL